MIESKRLNRRLKRKQRLKGSRPKRILVFILLSMVLLMSIYFIFISGPGMSVNKASDKLCGVWVRTDAPYTIEISDVMDEGKLTAKYFNPNPINVGRSGWQVNDEVIQLFVELQDKNYPGSIYRLNYIEEKDQLYGIYYQAVAGQTYEVAFKRKE